MAVQARVLTSFMVLARLLSDYIRGKAWMSFIDSASHMLGPDGKPRAEMLADDALHLNPEGYRMLTSLVKPRLEQALKRAVAR